MDIRLDKLVSERFGLSRRAAQEAVRNGRVDLAGVRCDEPGRLVAPEAAVTFDPNRPKARKVIGRQAIRVLFEDRHLLVVDKPAGLATHPSTPDDHDTLVSRVATFLAIRLGKDRPYVGIVHRLDRDTSGALVVARTPEAREALQGRFRAHEVERQYLAVVEGRVASGEGTIRLPLVTDEGTLRRRLAVEPGEGRPAVTHFRVVERFGPVATLLACWLETGRTHQIRLHLAAEGHPVLGDRVYRPRNQPRCKATFHRQALHARTLGFAHPFTGAAVRVEAPIPADFEALVADLRNRYGLPNAGG
jgi:23S rRNA pseudouridine1911/1915/1917 synthase